MLLQCGYFGFKQRSEKNISKSKKSIQQVFVFKYILFSEHCEMDQAGKRRVEMNWEYSVVVGLLPWWLRG